MLHAKCTYPRIMLKCTA